MRESPPQQPFSRRSSSPTNVAPKSSTFGNESLSVFSKSNAFKERNNSNGGGPVDNSINPLTWKHSIPNSSRSARAADSLSFALPETKPVAAGIPKRNSAFHLSTLDTVVPPFGDTPRARGSGSSSSSLHSTLTDSSANAPNTGPPSQLPKPPNNLFGTLPSGKVETKEGKSVPPSGLQDTVVEKLEPSTEGVASALRQIPTSSGENGIFDHSSTELAPPPLKNSLTDPVKLSSMSGGRTSWTSLHGILSSLHSGSTTGGNNRPISPYEGPPGAPVVMQGSVATFSSSKTSAGISLPDMLTSSTSSNTAALAPPLPSNRSSHRVGAGGSSSSDVSAKAKLSSKSSLQARPRLLVPLPGSNTSLSSTSHATLPLPIPPIFAAKLPSNSNREGSSSSFLDFHLSESHSSSRSLSPSSSHFSRGTTKDKTALPRERNTRSPPISEIEGSGRSNLHDESLHALVDVFSSYLEVKDRSFDSSTNQVECDKTFSKRKKINPMPSNLKERIFALSHTPRDASTVSPPSSTSSEVRRVISSSDAVRPSMSNQSLLQGKYSAGSGSREDRSTSRTFSPQLDAPVQRMRILHSSPASAPSLERIDEQKEGGAGSEVAEEANATGDESTLGNFFSPSQTSHLIPSSIRSLTANRVEKDASRKELAEEKKSERHFPSPSSDDILDLPDIDSSLTSVEGKKKGSKSGHTNGASLSPSTPSFGTTVTADDSSMEEKLLYAPYSNLGDMEPPLEKMVSLRENYETEVPEPKSCSDSDVVHRLLFRSHSEGEPSFDLSSNTPRQILDGGPQSVRHLSSSRQLFSEADTEELSGVKKVSSKNRTTNFPSGGNNTIRTPCNPFALPTGHTAYSPSEKHLSTTKSAVSSVSLQAERRSSEAVAPFHSDSPARASASSIESETTKAEGEKGNDSPLHDGALHGGGGSQEEEEEEGGDGRARSGGAAIAADHPNQVLDAVSPARKMKNSVRFSLISPVNTVSPFSGRFSSVVRSSLSYPQHPSDFHRSSSSQTVRLGSPNSSPLSHNSGSLFRDGGREKHLTVGPTVKMTSPASSPTPSQRDARTVSPTEMLSSADPPVGLSHEEKHSYITSRRASSRRSSMKRHPRAVGLGQEPPKDSLYYSSAPPIENVRRENVPAVTMSSNDVYDGSKKKNVVDVTSARTILTSKEQLSLLQLTPKTFLTYSSPRLATSLSAVCALSSSEGAPLSGSARPIMEGSEGVMNTPSGSTGIRRTITEGRDGTQFFNTDNSSYAGGSGSTSITNWKPAVSCEGMSVKSLPSSQRDRREAQQSETKKLWNGIPSEGKENALSSSEKVGSASKNDSLTIKKPISSLSSLFPGTTVSNFPVSLESESQHIMTQESESKTERPPLSVKFLPTDVVETQKRGCCTSIVNNFPLLRYTATFIQLAILVYACVGLVLEKSVWAGWNDWMISMSEMKGLGDFRMIVLILLAFSSVFFFLTKWCFFWYIQSKRRQLVKEAHQEMLRKNFRKVNKQKDPNVCSYDGHPYESERRKTMTGNSMAPLHTTEKATFQKLSSYGISQDKLSKGYHSEAVTLVSQEHDSRDVGYVPSVHFPSAVEEGSNDHFQKVEAPDKRKDVEENGVASSSDAASPFQDARSSLFSNTLQLSAGTRKSLKHGAIAGCDGSLSAMNSTFLVQNAEGDNDSDLHCFVGPFQPKSAPCRKSESEKTVLFREENSNKLPFSAGETDLKSAVDTSGGYVFPQNKSTYADNNYLKGQENATEYPDEEQQKFHITGLRRGSFLCGSFFRAASSIPSLICLSRILSTLFAIVLLLIMSANSLDNLLAVMLSSPSGYAWEYSISMNSAFMCNEVQLRGRCSGFITLCDEVSYLSSADALDAMCPFCSASQQSEIAKFTNTCSTVYNERKMVKIASYAISLVICVVLVLAVMLVYVSSLLVGAWVEKYKKGL